MPSYEYTQITNSQTKHNKKQQQKATASKTHTRTGSLFMWPEELCARESKGQIGEGDVLHALPCVRSGT